MPTNFKSIEMAKLEQESLAQVAKKAKYQKERSIRTSSKRKTLPKTHKYYNICKPKTIEEIKAYNDEYNQLYDFKIAIRDSKTNEIFADTETEQFKEDLFGFIIVGENRLTYKFAQGITKPNLFIIYYKETSELEIYDYKYIAKEKSINLFEAAQKEHKEDYPEDYRTISKKEQYEDKNDLPF